MDGLLSGWRPIQRQALFNMDQLSTRAIAPTDSLTDTTELLHAGYNGLDATGCNYTAVDQTEDVAHNRTSRGECLVAVEDET